MTKGFYDFRRMERFRLRVPALIERVREKEVEETLELVTSDICSGGAYFQTENPLPLGTEVKIEMILPLKKLKKVDGKHAHIHVSGAVIRATEKGMAICFEDDFVISPWCRNGKQEQMTVGHPRITPSYA